MAILHSIDPLKLTDPNTVHFAHPIDGLDLIETHISWVLLTGGYAYKIKKPVKFDFVDYSNLELRRIYCEKELELNRRYAAELYVDVVPIYCDNNRYWFGESPAGQLLPVEYAVKMKQFSQSALVATRLDDPAITYGVVEEFGKNLARFHLGIENTPAIPTLGHPEMIERLSEDNFTVLLDAFQGSHREKALSQLRDWCQQELKLKAELIDQRQKANLVKPVHGDLHLKNIVQRPDGRLLPFDGIEFNEFLQWNDIASEIAFPVMDFCARGRRNFGWRLFNAWLEEVKDLESVQLLRFFVVYRAMVRAKVTWLNPAHHSPASKQSFQQSSERTFDTWAGPWDRYIQIASEFAFPQKPNLVITHGLSGSGKSTSAMNWIDRCGGVRFRSDWVRMHEFGQLEMPERYSTATTKKVYDRLYRLAKMAIDSQISPVIDATFLNKEVRSQFLNLATKSQVGFKILDCAAPFAELRKRIEDRAGDISEATIEVVKSQIKTHEPLTSNELPFVVKSI